MTDLPITGRKGGESKPRPSVEAPDSLQSTPTWPRARRSIS
jgi:hypothetical protein